MPLSPVSESSRLIVPMLNPWPTGQDLVGLACRPRVQLGNSNAEFLGPPTGESGHVASLLALSGHPDKTDGQNQEDKASQAIKLYGDSWVGI
jgi:hypothetical protein